MSHTHRYAELSEARRSYSESLEKTSLMGGLNYGAPREIRTPDLLVRSQTLYPAELWAQIVLNCQSLHQPDRVFHFRYVRLASNRQLSYGRLSISFTELLYPLKIFKQVIKY